MDEQIGALIKQIRKDRGITLQTLAESSGLSVSYLSMLERGLSSPTISNLQKICQALHMTFTDLLLGLDEDKVCVKQSERRLIFNNHKGVVYEAISEGNRHMKSIYMRVSDSLEHVSEKHVADEFGYVVSGSMTMTLEGVPYELGPGDSLYITANTAHSFVKTSRDDCVSIWVYHNISLEDAKNYPTNYPSGH